MAAVMAVLLILLCSSSVGHAQAKFTLGNITMQELALANGVGGTSAFLEINITMLNATFPLAAGDPVTLQGDERIQVRAQ